MFTKILIANRGEIAVRVLRACREMGIRAVSVYSEADRQALHVRLADEAIEIGPAAAGESYLNIERILQAAHRCKAQAIHPGYGFLSENATFAAAVREAGMEFIGPSVEAIRLMGDKGAARAQVQAAGVPVTPGYQGSDDPASLARAAGQIGYPLLVKAAAGGGGKGMRVVRSAGDLDEAQAAARREAAHAFGDERLVLERFIENAHHVEFQVLGDAHGSLVHLFERECSVQRRHQKIIEESPSPLLDEALRAEMGRAAVTAARSVAYSNAGTVEFIVDPKTRRFYFLEMNTRLQVEHPVTEMVAGLDLVQWQIRLAAGERLRFSQEDLYSRGHAIECRLYAEDPSNDFLPVTGPLLRFVQPQGPGVRLDSGVTEGDAISIHYDPLVAKLIVWAEDRPSAIRKMQAALNETVLLGLVTNWQFLQDVLAHPDFAAGRVHTTWIENEYSGWQHPQCELPAEVLAAAALAQLNGGAAGTTVLDTARGREAFDPWRIGNNFRVSE